MIDYLGPVSTIESPEDLASIERTLSPDMQRFVDALQAFNLAMISIGMEKKFAIVLPDRDVSMVRFELMQVQHKHGYLTTDQFHTDRHGNLAPLEVVGVPIITGTFKR